MTLSPLTDNLAAVRRLDCGAFKHGLDTNKDKDVVATDYLETDEGTVKRAFVFVKDSNILYFTAEGDSKQDCDLAFVSHFEEMFPAN